MDLKASMLTCLREGFRLRQLFRKEVSKRFGFRASAFRPLFVFRAIRMECPVDSL